MDPDDGPMYYMKNFMKIQHPTKGTMQFDPFEYQYGLVETYHKYRNSIAMIGRQLGKLLPRLDIFCGTQCSSQIQRF